MNKLIYREIIKHINRSVMTQEIELYADSRHTCIHAVNPASKTILTFKEIFFEHNMKEITHYSLRAMPYIIISCDCGHIFSEEERKMLFELAKKRYNTYFKDMPERKSNLYRALLVSNSTTHNR